MELKLFDFIEEIMKEYEMNQPSYSYVEGCLKKLYGDLFKEYSDSVVSIHTRIKTSDSLKEKLIRNKFYLHYKTADEAIAHLTDLIGITIECRFIRNETELYQSLFRHFSSCKTGMNQCSSDPHVYLNLHMSQPQLQRNGFTIYRIDGTYQFNGRNVNYELQIKSLVHGFWSEIEHEVVYKNPDFVAYGHFLKELLATVRDNLDVVDRQLETIYDEISQESKSQQIGMDEKGFKVFIASSINELMNCKMKESVGFTTDFKQCSAILAQYIYVIDFLNGENNQSKMVTYLDRLNDLAAAPMNFRGVIQMEAPFTDDSIFCQTVGSYWLNIMNTDFEWHAFFVILFAIQSRENISVFTDFIHVIHRLLIQPGWYQSCFSQFSEKHAQEIRDRFELVLAKSLVETGSISMIHEDRMLEVMNIFRSTVEKTENEYPKYTELKKRLPDIESSLKHNIEMIFH